MKLFKKAAAILFSSGSAVYCSSRNKTKHGGKQNGA